MPQPDESAPDALPPSRTSQIVATLQQPMVGARVLTWIAVGAGALWALDFVHTGWTVWRSLGDATTMPTFVGIMATAGEGEPISALLRLRLTFQVAMETTGYYLLAAVFAYGLALLVSSSERAASSE